MQATSMVPNDGCRSGLLFPAFRQDYAKMLEDQIAKLQSGTATWSTKFLRIGHYPTHGTTRLRPLEGLESLEGPEFPVCPTPLAVLIECVKNKYRGGAFTTPRNKC